MTLQSYIQKLAYWTIPGGIYYRLNNYIQKVIENRTNVLLKIVKPNAVFKDIYKGKRCFIVCNSPSINTQNLLLLKNEIVFSVSNGYHRPGYLYFQPVYHCVPQVTYTDKFTQSHALNWFNEMDKNIGTATLFLTTSDYDLVQRNNLFANRPVYYTYYAMPWDKYGMAWDEKRTLLYDISKKIPSVMSVPIMCIMIAMYMGFKEIYLLGTEHDSAITKEYKYFSESIKIPDSNYINKKTTSMYLEFKSSFILWSQYRALKNIALSNGITIFNATAGGALDEFERVNFEGLFKK